MKTLVVRLPDTSNDDDDAIEIELDGCILATYEDADELNDWQDVVDLASKHAVDRIRVVTNDPLYGSYVGTAPDMGYTDSDIADMCEIRDGHYTLAQLMQWRSNMGLA